MVNSAEAGPLAGAKLLARNVVTDAQSVPEFTVPEEYVYSVAFDAATADRDYRPGSGATDRQPGGDGRDDDVRGHQRVCGPLKQTLIRNRADCVGTCTSRWTARCSARS